jgi:hypothetical protein
MAIISGIFNDPFGKPLANVLIQLTARTTTTVSITGTNAAAVTASDGSYSMPVLPGVYAVSAKIQYAPDYLGIIHVYTDSPDGTLNQYLAEFNPDDVTPEILREMQLILLEAKLAAESAWLAAAAAKKYALIPRGAFQLETEYQENDLVEYDGSEYRATADITGIAPPGSPWELFVAAGKPGEASTLTVGTVTTLEPGEDATVVITGDAPDQVLSMGIPAGKPGKPGEANTLTVGAVTTLEPGEAATVEITGNAPDQTINFGIPKGEDGGSHPFIPETWDAPGSIAMMYYQVSSQTEPRQAGTIFSGGSFTAGCVFKDGPTGDVTLENLEQAASGTWRLQGIVMAGNKGRSMTLAMRIDGAELPARVMLESALIGSRVKNCRYSAPDNSMIDCEVLVRDAWYPFTASANDSTTWGPVIYENAVNGKFGQVSGYS